MTKEQIGELQQITYFRQVKPPTLKQYLHRRFVKETMQAVQGEKGIGMDPDSNRQMPISAIKAREMLKGQTADDLIVLHPEWVEDYKKLYEQA